MGVKIEFVCVRCKDIQGKVKEDNAGLMNEITYAMYFVMLVVCG